VCMCVCARTCVCVCVCVCMCQSVYYVCVRETPRFIRQNLCAAVLSCGYELFQIRKKETKKLALVVYRENTCLFACKYGNIQRSPRKPWPEIALMG